MVRTRVGSEYTPGLIKGSWNFSRRENGVWEGSFFKSTKDSLLSAAVRGVEDISSVAWPIDAKHLRLWEESSWPHPGHASEDEGEYR